MQLIQRLQTKAEIVHALQIDISALVELQQHTFRAHLGHTDRLMGEGRRAPATNQRLLYPIIVNYTKEGKSWLVYGDYSLTLTWLTEMQYSSSRYSTAC